jgi:hypothetical protein
MTGISHSYVRQGTVTAGIFAILFAGAIDLA